MKKPEEHLRIIGSLYVFLGWFGIIFLIVVVGIGINDLVKFMRGNATGNYETFFIQFSLALLVPLALSILYIYFGKSLKLQKSWAVNYVGYLLSLLAMTSFPLGTMLGFYSIWGLFKYQNQQQTNTIRHQ